MSTLTSIPVSDPKRFLTLQESYRGELMGDHRLEEASALAARRQLLLENTRVDPDWALPQVKAMSSKLNSLTRRIRQPFGAAQANVLADEEDFVAGPVQALANRLASPLMRPGTAAIKTPANRPPVKRRDVLSPKVTPSTRKAKKKAKQKLNFRGAPARTQSRPKTPLQYNDQLGTPIPYDPATPSTSGLTPQSKAHSWLQGKAKTTGKQVAKSAAKSAGKRFTDWIGWTK